MIKKDFHLTFESSLGVLCFFPPSLLSFDCQKKKTHASFSANQMQIKTNGDFATCVFPRLRSVTCVYFSFRWVFVIITFVLFAVEMDLVLLQGH